jgi:hypothetical protein
MTAVENSLRPVPCPGSNGSSTRRPSKHVPEGLSAKGAARVPGTWSSPEQQPPCNLEQAEPTVKDVYLLSDKGLGHVITFAMSDQNPRRILCIFCFTAYRFLRAFVVTCLHVVRALHDLPGRISIAQLDKKI